MRSDLNFVINIRKSGAFARPFAFSNDRKTRNAKCHKNNLQLLFRVSRILDRLIVKFETVNER